MVNCGWREGRREPMGMATSIKMALFIIKTTFSSAERLVCSRVESTRELNTRDRNCTQVSMIPVHSFKGKA